MNIQPISAFNAFQNRNTKIQKKNSQPAFSGEQKRSEATDVLLKNAAKSLALASAIAFTPALFTSCEKEFTEEDCNHPNHIDPPIPNDSTDNKPDTIINGITYKTPALRMPRYKIQNGDTINIGSVTFSPGIVYVPNNAHKSVELQTVMNFLDAMGLESKNLTEEYVATKAFAYNMIPAQITWLDEKNGVVNQIKYNGYDENSNIVKMDLTTIGEENTYNEKELQLTSAGENKILVDVYPKGSSTRETSYFLSKEGDIISKFKVANGNTFKLETSYSANGSGNSIDAKNADGTTYKLANFDVLTAISEEE